MIDFYVPLFEATRNEFVICFIASL